MLFLILSLRKRLYLEVFSLFYRSDSIEMAPTSSPIWTLLQRVKHTRQTCFIRSQDSATMGQHTDSERSLLRGLPGKPRAVMESTGNYHLPEA